MEAKMWAFSVSLIFVVALLPVTLLLIESPESAYAFMGEFKYIFPPILQGSWPSEKKQKISFAVSPNLTTCHQTYGRPDLLVYCCPPVDESQETIVDFQFPDPSLPLRVRRPTHRLDADYIAKYNKALSIMKSLPYSDPRNFIRQANMHCIYCTGAYNEQYGNVELNIHGSWLFFPWHRMFLHFHERILGNLIGDDTFALPFWPWDHPDRMTMPEMYLNASFFDKERDNSHFPPSVVDLDFWGIESGLNAEEQIKTNMAIMYNEMVSGAKKLELFLGCPLKAGEGGYCRQPGTIEIGSHDTVHNWVGSNLRPAREHMGKFYSAARDPIFYPHHSNIDRLWEIWRELHGNEIISDPDWLNSHFFFHDEKLQLVRIKFQDVLNITKLRYAYEELEIPWLNARPKPSIPPKAARPILKMRETLSSNYNFLSSDFRPHGRALDTRISIKVIRPKINRTKQEIEKEEEVLVVYGIDVQEDIFVKFDVYVNVVDETIINPHFREFAGSFVQIPSVRPVPVGASRKQNLKLGLSELLQDLEAEADGSIWVTLFPRTKSCVNTTIDGIKIDYLR